MKVRAAIAGALTRARLAAAGCGALTVLACTAVSACSGSPPKAAAVPSITSALSSASSAAAHGSPSPGGLYSGTAHVPAPTASTAPAGGPSSHPPAQPSTTHAPTTQPSTHPPAASPTAHPPTRSPAPPAPATQAPSPTIPAVPAAPPSTGGGGTAGLQDGLLFALGGAAILAGVGGIAYRRRIVKSRR